MKRKYERGEELAGQSLAEELPSLALEGDLVVNRDLSLAAGWSLQLPNTLLAGDEVRASFATLFRSIINSLPGNFDWQLRWVQHSRTTELAELFAARPKPAGLAGDIVRETESVTLALLGTREIAWKEAHFFIVRRPTRAEQTGQAHPPGPRWRRAASDLANALRALRPGSAVAEAQAESATLREMLADVHGVREAFEPALQASGCAPRRLDSPALLTAFYEWANKERYETGGTPPDYPAHGAVPLAELYALTEFEWGTRPAGLPSGIFRMGDSFQAILTLALPPEELRLGVWENILYSGLTRLELTTWGTPSDKHRRIGRLRRVRQALLSRGDAPEQRRQVEEIDRELEELGGNTDRLWRFFATFRLWGDTPDEAAQAVKRLIIAGESQGRISVVHERQNLWAFLRATCPGWTQDCDPYRAIDVTTRQLCRLLPFQGQPSCLALRPDAVGALFSTVSSTGGLFNIDPHERTLYNAPHFVISAGTGQGKSVLVASLILELLGEDGRAVMIDRGGSFDGLAAAMDVVPVKLVPGNAAIRLNPLYVAPGRLPDADELGGMLLLLEVMVMSAAQQEGRLPGEESRTLRETLQRMFESRPGEQRTLGELRDALADVQAGRWLAANLSVWCAGGEYGTLFDGLNNIPLGGRLTVIDLGQDARGANQALTNVLTMLVISIVSQLMSHGGVRRKYVVFDEAGVLMKNKAQADFLEYAYRTFRKSGTGVGALTQKAMDLAALFSYAPLKFFLRQDDLDDTRAAAGKAGFADEAVAFIRDLETRPGEYADFVVVQQTPSGTQSHLCRNPVTPLKYAMVTSDKEDTYAMQQWMREHGWTRAQAMREFARRYPRGVAFARAHAAESPVKSAA